MPSGPGRRSPLDNLEIARHPPSRLSGGEPRVRSRRSAPRYPRASGPQGALARADARLGHRPAARPALPRRLQGPAGLALSRAPADAPEGLDRLGVAAERERPAGPLL